MEDKTLRGNVSFNTPSPACKQALTGMQACPHRHASRPRSRMPSMALKQALITRFPQWHSSRLIKQALHGTQAGPVPS